jgi:hypothetical protein
VAPSAPKVELARTKAGFKVQFTIGRWLKEVVKLTENEILLCKNLNRQPTQKPNGAKGEKNGP